MYFLTGTTLFNFAICLSAVSIVRLLETAGEPETCEFTGILKVDERIFIAIAVNKFFRSVVLIGLLHRLQEEYDFHAACSPWIVLCIHALNHSLRFFRSSGWAAENPL